MTLNINVKTTGGILSEIHSMMTGGGLKSVQERQERKDKSEREIAFFEKQKENLKNKECGTLEEIERKLEMLHTYEDEIAAVKAAYNREEMSHILDEVREQGEKIAEAVEKQEPKTAQERREEMAQEALGLEEEKGVLTQALEELEETVEEIVSAEEITAAKKITAAEENAGNPQAPEEEAELPARAAGQTLEGAAAETAEEILLRRAEMQARNRRLCERFDARA